MLRSRCGVLYQLRKKWRGELFRWLAPSGSFRRMVAKSRVDLICLFLATYCSAAVIVFTGFSCTFCL